MRLSPLRLWLMSIEITYVGAIHMGETQYKSAVPEACLQYESVMRDE